MSTSAQASITPYRDEYRDQLTAVWERSVRATHHFLLPEDIDYFKQVVQGIDFHAFPVYCLVRDNTVLGFLGVAGGKIEMLFLDPAHIGKGYGRLLMRFALEDLGADKVDVNEQNSNAVAFYTRFGFVPIERTEKDSEGKDYPIIKMKRIGSAL